MSASPYEGVRLKPRRRTAAIHRPANAGGWRLLVAAFALVTFALQSYVTQTHIHFDRAAFADMAKTSGPHGKYPFKDDPADCPICQDVALAGHYVTPAAIVFVPPADNVAIIPVSIAVAFIVEAVSHGWRGRAPPHA